MSEPRRLWTVRPFGLLGREYRVGRVAMLLYWTAIVCGVAGLAATRLADGETAKLIVFMVALAVAALLCTTVALLGDRASRDKPIVETFD